MQRSLNGFVMYVLLDDLERQSFLKIWIDTRKTRDPTTRTLISMIIKNENTPDSRQYR